jgi:lantibiotic modifying enzyme
VYKVYVGNIDDADVESYINTIADRFKECQLLITNRSDGFKIQSIIK